MTQAIDPPASAGHPAAAGTGPIAAALRPGSNRPDPLHGALLESRQRWRDLVLLAADIAFETDAFGRFAFIAPDPVFGWQAGTLLGQPAALLLADPPGMPGFDPFRPVARARGRRAWLKRGDGGHVCLSFACLPLHDAQGQVVGVRGVGHDVTAQDGAETSLAAALRRSQAVDHILADMHREVQAPRMMKAALGGLTTALGAAGGAVVDMLGDGVQASVMHQVGVPPAPVMHTAMSLLEATPDRPSHGLANDGRWTLVCPGPAAAGSDPTALVLWRELGGRPWDGEDVLLALSASSIVRVVLQHETMQRDMSEQARTDPLTGLLNRRAFVDEATRRLDRLDREGLPGTLMFVDLDNFKQLNDRCGHDVGDEALCLVADLLRETVRPADLVARLGGDEFAVWMDGADDLAAAERAEHLTIVAPRRLAALAPGHDIRLGMSIGMATRWPGTEALEETLQRADQAMYEVKRAGRGRWRAHRAAAS